MLMVITLRPLGATPTATTFRTGLDRWARADFREREAEVVAD
jgi:hypothetical protein